MLGFYGMVRVSFGGRLELKWNLLENLQRGHEGLIVWSSLTRGLKKMFIMWTSWKLRITMRDFPFLFKDKMSYGYLANCLFLNFMLTFNFWILEFFFLVKLQEKYYFIFQTNVSFGLTLIWRDQKWDIWLEYDKTFNPKQRFWIFAQFFLINCQESKINFYQIFV